MEIVIAAVVVALGLAAGLVVAALLLAKRMPGGLERKPAAPRQPAPEAPARDEGEALARSAEMGRQEERLMSREEALDGRLAAVERQAEALAAPPRERLR